MFDIGFSELLVIAVVALLVLGPERLPKAARFAGLWVRKARAQWYSVKSEFERDLSADELRCSRRESRESLREADEQLRSGADSIRSQVEHGLAGGSAAAAGALPQGEEGEASAGESSAASTEPAQQQEQDDHDERPLGSS